MQAPRLLQSLLRVSAPFALLSAPMLADGEIQSYVEVDDLQGGLGAVLNDYDYFGWDVASIGDLDGDGVTDLIVGAPGDGSGYGEAWIVFLNPDGTVKQRQVIVGPDPNVWFGYSVASLGDVNGDGNTDVAIGTFAYGAHLYFLNPDGTVQGSVFYPDLSYYYGYVSGPGDVDQDGVRDLIVGGPTNSFAKGRIWIHFLNPDGTIKQTQEVGGDGLGGFLGAIQNGEGFGYASTSVGDLDGDGVVDLAVSAPWDQDLANAGAIWILFMNTDGTVKLERKLSALTGDLDGVVEENSLIGITLASTMDLDGNGTRDLIAGTLKGFYLLFLRPDGSVRSHLYYDQDEFGSSGENLGRGTTVIPDLDGDGNPEIVVGVSRRDGGGDNRGGINVNFWGGASVAQAGPFGCGQNPVDSLVAQGGPILGSTMTFEIDNPFGTHNAGSLGFLALSFSNLTGGGCGLPLPGYHMNPAQPSGEVLIGFPLALPEILGTPWAPGAPSEVGLPIPHEPVLLGAELFAQGLLFDPTGGSTGTNLMGLTRGLALRIGT